MHSAQTREHWEAFYCGNSTRVHESVVSPAAVLDVLVDELHSLLGSLNGIVVGEFGCGTSTLGLGLAYCLPPSCRVIGIDYSCVAVALAQDFTPEHNVIEAEVFPFPVDVVIAKGVAMVSLEAILLAMGNCKYLICIEEDSSGTAGMRRVMTNVSCKRFDGFSVLSGTRSEEQEMITAVLERLKCTKFEVVSAIDRIRSNREAVNVESLVTELEMDTCISEVDDNDDDECIVCFDKETNSCLIECGHVCVCYDCAVELLRLSQPCPICRVDIRQAIKIHRVYSDSTQEAA